MKTVKFLSTLLVAGGIALSATVATSAFAQPAGKPTVAPTAIRAAPRSELVPERT